MLKIIHSLFHLLVDEFFYIWRQFPPLAVNNPFHQFLLLEEVTAVV